MNADRPEARLSLGSFYLRRGRAQEAEAEYRAALKLNPQFAAGYINLADLHRRANREEEGISTLRDGLSNVAQNAPIHHALGLALVRTKAPQDEAIETLARAAALAPDNPQYGYVHGVALHSAGRIADALGVLKDTLSRHPGHRETLVALVGYEQEAGDKAAALRYAERLSEIMPEDATLRRLIDELRKQTK